MSTRSRLIVSLARNQALMHNFINAKSDSRVQDPDILRTGKAAVLIPHTFQEMQKHY